MRSLLFFVSIISVMTAVADIRAQGQHTANVPEDIPVGFHPERYAPVWERNPFVLVTATAQEHSPFEKFFLTSWLKDGSTDIIFVRNSDTNDVQKITTTPNQAGLRLIALRLNANPLLSGHEEFNDGLCP